MSMNKTEVKLTEEKKKQHVALKLTCPICLQLFTEPVSLPCGHVYCMTCLQTMDAGLDHHCCPECQVKYEGTNALVKNFKTFGVRTGKVNPVSNPSGVNDEKLNSNVSSTLGNSESKHQHEEGASSQRDEEISRYPLKELGGWEHAAAVESKGKDHSHTGLEDTEQLFSLDKKQGKTKIKTEMDEPKFKLASQVTELTIKLEIAEGILKKEKEQEMEIKAANAQLRGAMATLLERARNLSQSYDVEVTTLVEEELYPGELSISGRVSRASGLTKQLRQAVLKAESLLTEDDGTVFTEDFHNLQPHIAELMAKPFEEAEDNVDLKVNPMRACSKLVHINAELKSGLGEIQRSLLNVLNPSEVTFDLETAHPNLVLSEDLKTATFSATKQPYPSSPQRFTNFLQVLSTQSFYGGEYCWEVLLEGSPWIIGVCYRGKLARSGLPSALESSRCSWCLMWFDNLLSAFEQGHSVPLKKTTVSRRLEIKLSFKTHRLSFYNISPSSGKTHIYTFKANLVEPVHLAYRMMSGQPKACITIC
ncbi:E3 ubiquitin/ISG15 ligase TRIM25 isoform X2 [Lampris incognitus]|nr:E3 ubiquitin/ISG15 ligase TRIM25 isoform X2 [Lampris incognitus]